MLKHTTSITTLANPITTSHLDAFRTLAMLTTQDAYKHLVPANHIKALLGYIQNDDLEAIASKPSDFVLGAWQNSQLVGMLIAETRAKDSMLLRALSVHPQHCRLGIATRLVQTAEQIAQSCQDVLMFRINVLSSDERAISFWQKQGYVKKHQETIRLLNDISFQTDIMIKITK